MSASQSARGGSSSQVGIILATVFLAYLGQTTLNPVIAPLSREVGLDEWQIGFTISVAAVMVVLTSQVWGRRSQSWGRKPVLIAALAICMAAMVLFAVVAALGMSQRGRTWWRRRNGSRWRGRAARTGGCGAHAAVFCNRR